MLDGGLIPLGFVDVQQNETAPLSYTINKFIGPLAEYWRLDLFLFLRENVTNTLMSNFDHWKFVDP